MARTTTHWLTAIAETAGWCAVGQIELDPDTSPEEAWARVATVCGFTEQGLARQVALATHCDVADPDSAEPHAVDLLPQSVARRYMVFPLRQDYRRLVVAVHNPRNFDVQQAVTFASGRTAVMEVAPPRVILELIESRYSLNRNVEKLLSTLASVAPILSSVAPKPVAVAPKPVAVAPKPSGDALKDSGLKMSLASAAAPVEVPKAPSDDLNEEPLIRLSNLILNDAISKGASDIHIQPSETGGTVRLRIDGLLRHYMYLPIPVMMRVISRIKIMGEMDISDRMRPQDGRARFTSGDRVCDLRISTVPTRHLEKAVIRLLGAAGPVTLGDVGLSAGDLAQLRRLLQNRQGIIIVTGPTGSGKTTTLYAALKEIGTTEVNIMTVEDPVEYELPTMTQIQVETRQGVTFASALRAILRQDPDVIFVGEIRDAETAQIAVQASRTGHLVLATLHTNDAIGSIGRFSDLGLDGATLADSLRGVLAQRLLRRICAVCATKVEDGTLTPQEIELQAEFGVAPTVRAKGCSECNSGFRGRIPIVEIFRVTPRVASLIIQGGSAAQLQELAISEGMRLMREAALERVRNGETTLEEVERVVGRMTDTPEASAAEPEQTDQLRGSEEVAANIPETPCILVVDDDGTTRAIARQTLTKEGYRVAEASSGSAALEMLEHESYALMVLDLGMPNLSGRDVLTAVRQGIKTVGLPVIVLTGTESPEAENELMDMGADDYIRKPIDPPRFIARVKATLRRTLG